MPCIRYRADLHSANRETIRRVRYNYLSRIRGGVRRPEGVWGWVGKRRELKRLCRYLANRETIGYFRGASIAKTHKLHTVIRNHCLSMQFTKQMESGGADYFQDSFGKFSGGATGEYLNTDAPGGNFGRRMFTITQKLNLANNARAIP